MYLQPIVGIFLVIHCLVFLIKVGIHVWASSVPKYNEVSSNKKINDSSSEILDKNVWNFKSSDNLSHMNSTYVTGMSYIFVECDLGKESWCLYINSIGYPNNPKVR